MDNWDSAFLDLVKEAHLTFQGKSDGEIAFRTLKGFLDLVLEELGGVLLGGTAGLTT